MLSARLSPRNSVRPSVCPSVTRVYQAKTVQARITKSSSSAVWKTLVSRIVKFFHKFEGGHPNEGAKWERGRQNVRFLANKSLYLSNCEIRHRLLLITNRKSYTGSRLAPNSVTLNDLERQNRGFYGSFDDFERRHKSVSFTRRRHGTILCVLRYDCNRGVLFYPKFPRCTISLYCVRNNLLFSTFLMHRIWWNGLHRPRLQCNLW